MFLYYVSCAYISQQRTCLTDIEFLASEYGCLLYGRRHGYME